MEGQLVVSTFARYIRLALVNTSPVGISPQITLRPDRKIEMRVEKLGRERA